MYEDDDDNDGSCQQQPQYQDHPQQPQHPEQTHHYSGERLTLIYIILMLIESG